MTAPSPFALEARGLVKRFGDLTAVDGLDLRARRGTCLGLLGPNGAGKTTTIEILEGLTPADGGDVSVLGLGWKSARREIQARIGVQLQETRLQDKLTVYESLRLFRSFYAHGRDLGEVLGLIGLKEKRNARYVTLSGGQKQRLALGCALVSRPEILFLDEPTTGLDPQARRRVWEIVEGFKQDGGTVLLTTHYMDEAERLADHLCIIDHGRIIAEGSPRDIIESLGAKSIVEFAVAPGDDGERPAIDRDALADLPGVAGVREGDGRVMLSVTDTSRALAGLLEWLGRSSIDADDLRTHRPTLEDVFVSLTGKHLRDE